MGYSIGFLRSYLAFLALGGVVAIVIGAANEVLGLGLFSGGYPVFGDPGAGFEAFAIQAAIVILVAGGLSAFMERWDRRAP